EHAQEALAAAVADRQAVDLDRAGLHRRRRRAHSSTTRFRPSATRFTPTTRVARAAAGKITIHHATCMYARPFAIWRPQSGDGSCRPSPRNEIVAAVKMAYARRTVASTVIGPVMVGRIS